MKSVLLLICTLVGIVAAKPQSPQQETSKNAKEQAEALLEFGRNDTFRINDVKQDDAETVQRFRKAADQGDASAQFNLARLYAYGHGVPQDYTEAAKWCRKAADQGDAFAQLNLGVFYTDGHGVPQDYTQAAKWYRKAAGQGYIDPQVKLGILYANGQGVPQDYAEAAKWYRKAADQGDIRAQVYLGILYANGQGVLQDYAERSKWYRRAAAQGESSAYHNLGEIYRTGTGVNQDYIEAYAYYSLAAASGHDDEARKVRDAIAATYLKGAAVLAAQQRARALKAELDAEKNAPVSVPITDFPELNPLPAAKAEPKIAAFGSGFIAAAGGLVVTNWHVVENATRIELVTNRGKFSAKVVASDPSNDLAILRTEKPLPAALPLRSSRGLKLGAEVFTIGFPNPDLQGFSPKYNRGDISSLAGATDDPRYFQISVPIQPGNSGGALCDAEGRVVGVVSARLNRGTALKTSGQAPENVNYAVKSSYLLALLESLDLPAGTLAAEPAGKPSPEDARQRAQQAAVLVVVY